MSNAENVVGDAVARLRAEVEVLRQAPTKKGGLSDGRRQELVQVVARATQETRPFRLIDSELAAFPPQVVARGIASVWDGLDVEVRNSVLGRLKSLDADRLVGEGIPMALHLLRSRETQESGTGILALLPRNEKSVQRIAAEVFGKDASVISALGVAADQKTAASVFRLLLAAAAMDKALAFRRLQLLQLILPWLAEADRYARQEFRSIVTQVREIIVKLDGSVGDEWRDTLSRHDEWRPIVGNGAATQDPHVQPIASGPSLPASRERQEASAPRPQAQTTPERIPPLTSRERQERSVLPQHPETPPSVDRLQQIPVDEARATLTSLRDRRMREARALDRLLAAERSADALKAQAERELRNVRDQLRLALVKADEMGVSLDTLRAELIASEEKRREAVRVGNAKDVECDSLKGSVATAEAGREAAARERERESAAWEQQRIRLEEQVVENANGRLRELGSRVASRLRKLLSDVPDRNAPLDGVAAVLNTRIHELLDALDAEGIPIREAK